MEIELKDVCERASSNIRQKDIATMRGNYPIYGAAGLIDHVNFYHQERPYIAVVKDGAGIGRVMLLPSQSSVIGTMQYLIPNEKVIPKYLYYVVKNMHLEKYYTGATIPHIYFRDYQYEKFNLVSFKHQQEIVDTLSKIENVIIIRQRELAELDTLIKARFVEMFGDIQTNEKRWKVGTIKDIVSDVKYGTSKKAAEGNTGKYPYLRMNNITYSGELDLHDLKTIDISKDEISKYSVKKGDILFNRTNSKDLVGKTCVYDQEKLMVLAGFIVRVRLNDKALPEFVSTFLNTDYSKELFKTICKNASGQSNINAKELQKINIYIPPIKLQKQFIDFKKQVDKSKVVNHTLLEYIINIRFQNELLNKEGRSNK